MPEIHLSQPVDADVLTPHWLTGQVIHPGLRLALGVEHAGAWRAAEPDEPRFALSLIEAGSALIECAGVSTLVSAPMVVLLDERTRPRVQQAQQLRCVTVYFHPLAVNAAFDLATVRGETASLSDSTRRDLYLLGPFLAGATLLALSPAAALRVRDGLRQLEREARTQDEWNWPCRTRAFLIELLFVLRLQAETPTPALAGEASRLDQALLLVHERFASAFTLDDLARWVGSNRTSVNRHFRERVGQSVRSYVIALRMAMATRLLRETALPVAEIVGRVGYDNQSHFSRAFRAGTGMTPTQYRDTYGWLR
ncbi:helix-turn-helix domain-containing protein [Jeongeupia chitinilytica]|uniref:HTH araC/xylS-type domain-containing protein n=1 Tax=Jeongeupia chitinilytica TaxID=1041641 RepID=A0ABQ3GZ12_9NEIS|nr:AraC family transcriptional regulator [Jeongeupia chitinilytica]GHD62102.1 hypothetical protein GCM10007350_17540 [Jeongeupia chitinilytica]